MSIANGDTNIIVQAFSWMLVHSLWQGTLLAIVAAIVLISTKNAAASVRYNLVLVLFSFFLIAGAFTFCYELNNLSPKPSQAFSGNDLQYFNAAQNNNASWSTLFSTDSNAYTLKAFIVLFNKCFSAHCFLIVMLWFAFFVAKSVSLIGNTVYMHRVRHYRIYVPDTYWKKNFTSLCEKMQIKKAVSLLESGYVKIPVVIGYLKPVILLPAGLMAGIPAAQVEAVLLHELAHIRRNDYLINILQRIAEAVFFFNPALLWISSLLREERENCCDDIAINQTNNKQAFIEALISFKEYTVTWPTHAIAFSGQKSMLLNRIMRIVYQENKTLSVKENGILVASLALLGLMVFTLYQPVQYMKLKMHSYSSKNISEKFERVLRKPSNNDKVVLPGTSSNKLSIVKVSAVNNHSTIRLAKPPASDIVTDDAVFLQTEKETYKMPSLNEDKFYSRTALDSGRDIIRVRFAGRGVETTLRHNAPVAMIINGVIYDESEAANLSQPQIDALKKEPIGIGNSVNARNRYPDLDLSKYEAYIALGDKSNPRTNISPDD